MKLVKAHGNAKLVNGPRKPRESKWARDAQGKTKGTLEPMSRNTSGHAKPLGEGIKQQA